jgi:hypothetical protein
MQGRSLQQQAFTEHASTSNMGSCSHGTCCLCVAKHMLTARHDGWLGPQVHLVDYYSALPAPHAVLRSYSMYDVIVSAQALCCCFTCQQQDMLDGVGLGHVIEISALQAAHALLLSHSMHTPCCCFTCQQQDMLGRRGPQPRDASRRYNSPRVALLIQYVRLLTQARCCFTCLQDMLDGVGLGHVTHLTRCEWSVLRGAAGRPRRLSLTFLKQERHKLEAYRCALLQMLRFFWPMRCMIACMCVSGSMRGRVWLHHDVCVIMIALARSA